MPDWFGMYGWILDNDGSLLLKPVTVRLFCTLVNVMVGHWKPSILQKNTKAMLGITVKF